MAAEGTVAVANGTGRGRGLEDTRGTQFYRPNVDIYEQEEELVVQADMPGVQPDQLEVRFEDGLLTIHGPVSPRRPEAARNVHAEFGVGDFFRSFRVSEQIDASGIAADYHDGVLTLHLPKAPAARPRKIAVRTK
jgi:HSP20 family protein